GALPRGFPGAIRSARPCGARTERQSRRTGNPLAQRRYSNCQRGCRRPGAQAQRAMNPFRMLPAIITAFGVFWAAILAGCSVQAPSGALVLTQTPTSGAVGPGPNSDLLDHRYPTGSRVVLAVPPFRPDAVQVLSKGMAAAGDPVVCP